MGIGRAIKHYRIAAGLTQKQLAEKISASQQAVASYERDYREPDREITGRIAEALNTTRVDLERFADTSDAATVAALSDALYRYATDKSKQPIQERLENFLSQSPHLQDRQRTEKRLLNQFESSFRRDNFFAELRKILTPGLSEEGYSRILEYARDISTNPRYQDRSLFDALAADQTEEGSSQTSGK